MSFRGGRSVGCFRHPTCCRETAFATWRWLFENILANQFFLYLIQFFFDKRHAKITHKSHWSNHFPNSACSHQTLNFWGLIRWKLQFFNNLLDWWNNRGKTKRRKEKWMNSMLLSFFVFLFLSKEGDSRDRLCFFSFEFYKTESTWVTTGLLVLILIPPPPLSLLGSWTTADNTTLNNKQKDTLFDEFSIHLHIFLVGDVSIKKTQINWKNSCDPVGYSKTIQKSPLWILHV